MVMRRPAIAIAVLALVLAGCSDTSNDGGSSEGGSPTQDVTTSEHTGEPSPEPTDPETTQEPVDKPSVKIAQLPVGGGADGNCNSVNWLGGDVIRPGTTMTLGTPTFDPDDIFEVDQSACGDSRSCEGLEWTADSQEACSVGFKQVGTQGTVTLKVPAAVTCATQADCDELKKKEGSQIMLTAVPPETPSEEPETPSEEPETPSEEPATPSETPSGE